MTVAPREVVRAPAREWQRYPEYEASGIEWLGEIPEHWDIKPLKFLATTNMGQSPSSEEVDVDGIGMPFLQGNGEFGSQYPMPRLYCSTARKYADVGDYLLSVRAPVGAINVADQRYGIGRGLCAIAPRVEHLDRRFTEYLLRVVRVELDAVATGSTYEAVSVEDVSNVQCVRPPMQEQRSIATFLARETEKVNDLIAKRERLIELLEEKRTALISQAVTKGLNPEVPMKDSEVEWVGEIPEHWQIKRIKYLADVRSGVAKGRNLGDKETVALPYLRVANVQDGYLDLSDVATIAVGTNEVNTYRLEVGDVLMNEGGDYDKLGRGSVWRGEIDPCLHQNHVFAIRPRLGFEPEWLGIITLTAYAKHYFILRSKQSTNLASISSTNLQNLPVVLPPPDERSTILAFLSRQIAKIDGLIGKNREHIEKLREYRTALISAAVTGKIDVREEVS